MLVSYNSSGYTICYRPFSCGKDSVGGIPFFHCRLQTQNIRYGEKKYKGTFQTMFKIGKEEGITRLWR